jgi:CheY-like chemotaxis protein
LFEPFFTTKDIGKGTGLGLATVYGIAQQHAGWVEVASTLGAGTTFTIFLPALDVSAKAPGGGDGLGSHTGNETILVVEDEPMVRNLAKLCLVRCGYTVLEAGSGPEALNLWPAHRAEVDLLFTDIVMPGGMTGRELAKRLVADKPGLRVVFTSGYSRALLVDDSRWIDQITYIAKPYNLALLARVVRQCLDEPADAVRSPQPDDEPS